MGLLILILNCQLRSLELNLPNFFCIGVQKAGTTLLYEHLKGIEEIYLPEKKELHFFDSDDYKKGEEWYAHYFSKAQKQKAIGEITPIYIFMEDIPQKIATSSMNQAKFIVILRNPIERAYSHYVMTFRRGEENLSFKESFLTEAARTKESISNLRKYSYFQRGFYLKQIKNYFQYFDKSQFLFILFEDFVKKQDETIAEVCNFLEVKKNIKIEAKEIHNSNLTLKNKIVFMKLNKNNPLKIFHKDYPTMNNCMKQKIKYYHDDIRALEKLIDKDLSLWLE